MTRPHSHWAQAHHACQQLNRVGLSAFPVRTLALISIGVDTGCAIGAHNLIGPLQRLRIVSVLEPFGYESNDGCELVSREPGPAQLRFPRDGETLVGDPSDPVREELRSPGRIVWATSTQTLLCLLHQSGGQHELTLQRELLHLVWEQPAELALVRQHARAARLRKTESLLAPLARAQGEGIELRRRHEFSSLLPQ